MANELTVALGVALAHSLWQCALVGAVAAVLLAMLRHAAPGARYLVAGMALAACLLWPALAAWSVLDGGARGAMAAADGWRGVALALPDYARGLEAWLPALVLAWLAGSCALSLRSALGLVWIARAARDGGRDAHWQHRLDALAARFGIGRAVRLRVVESLASPVTAGWWRPVVLVPAALVSGMPPDLLEALLAHELAHVRRHDYLVNLLQNIVENLLFYHPAVWWLSRRLRHERELIADALAASVSGEPRRLALALSELEKIQFSHHPLALGADGGDLMDRIKRLVQPQQSQSAAPRWLAAVPALALAATLATAFTGVNAAPKDKGSGDHRAIVDFRSCNKPAWPQADLDAEHTGTVVLSFKIGTDGKVADSKVVKTSGFPGLDEAARSGISHCAFTPARKDGKNVATWQQMQYVWTLE